MAVGGLRRWGGWAGGWVGGWVGGVGGWVGLAGAEGGGSRGEWCGKARGEEGETGRGAKGRGAGRERRDGHDGTRGGGRAGACKGGGCAWQETTARGADDSRGRGPPRRPPTRLRRRRRGWAGRLVVGVPHRVPTVGVGGSRARAARAAKWWPPTARGGGEMRGGGPRGRGAVLPAVAGAPPPVGRPRGCHGRRVGRGWRARSHPGPATTFPPCHRLWKCGWVCWPGRGCKRPPWLTGQGGRAWAASVSTATAPIRLRAGRWRRQLAHGGAPLTAGAVPVQPSLPQWGVGGGGGGGATRRRGGWKGLVVWRGRGSGGSPHRVPTASFPVTVTV